VPAYPNLLPYVTHSIGATNVGPVVQEVGNLNLHVKACQRMSSHKCKKTLTFRMSSYIAEKVENASYGTFSTVRDLIMCCDRSFEALLHTNL
jgi:hypothetical protein